VVPRAANSVSSAQSVRDPVDRSRPTLRKQVPCESHEKESSTLQETRQINQVLCSSREIFVLGIHSKLSGRRMFAAFSAARLRIECHLLGSTPRISECMSCRRAVQLHVIQRIENLLAPLPDHRARRRTNDVADVRTDRPVVKN
jgi:hypothetical protein